MKIAHRNTNQVLSFSFSLLLGSYADRDPRMALFTNLNEYTHETIPDDPRTNHPNAGKPCVEELGRRHYRVNFAVHSGPLPSVHRKATRSELVRNLVSLVRADIETGGIRPDDVLVLAPLRRSVIELCAAFVDAGFQVHCPLNFRPGAKDVLADLRARGLNGDKRGLPFRQPGAITIGTIKSAKGHTAHVVHLAFIEELDGEGERGQHGRAELHVACTRATTLLHVWGTTGGLLDEAEDAHNAVRSG